MWRKIKSRIRVAHAPLEEDDEEDGVGENGEEDDDGVDEADDGPREPRHVEVEVRLQLAPAQAHEQLGHGGLLRLEHHRLCVRPGARAHHEGRERRGAHERIVRAQGVRGRLYDARRGPLELRERRLVEQQAAVALGAQRGLALVILLLLPNQHAFALANDAPQASQRTRAKVIYEFRSKS